MFARRSAEVNKLIPQLYLHGLALGDFDLALRGLLGEKAPVSASTVARLKEGWQAEWEEWKKHPLDGLEVLFMWVDGVYVKAGLEKEKAALLVVVGGLSDGRKVILAVEPGYRESTESWSGVLRDLKKRGMNCPRLVTGDGNLGIWGALSNVYPEVLEQRCWNHKIVNVLDKLPKKVQPQAKWRLQDIAYAESRQEAEEKRDVFLGWCRKDGHRSAGETLLRDWDRMVTFYQFPQEHWKHLRTTNVVESPFAALRLRTDAAKRYKKVENATAVIWKMLMLAERRFRRLDAPEKLKLVYLGFGVGEAHEEPEIKREEVLALA
jgi:transposase-like protein